MKEMPKIIVVLGQTATGKSDFAVEIAQTLQNKVLGEIISADSRQVYRGMNLGTGKITYKEMRGVPHHLLDIISPKKTFTVSEFKKLADKKIDEILERGNIPIVCGGTGFYIDALVDNIILPEVPPNSALREGLNKKTAAQLVILLRKLDPGRAKVIDINNKVRLIRAIEIANALGKVPKIKGKQKYDVLKIGLALPDEVLKEKIRTRLTARIKKGMLKEIKSLHDKGVSWRRMQELGLEYRYGALYLQKKISKQEMIEKLNTEIWHYAKRQKTWFKRDQETAWIDPRKESERRKVTKKISEFLK
ncbi:MAG: tRNA (adenosine(37)-N6)-dimethylallyltransferase MiaA [Patescibacteria group bacterium]